MMVARWGVLAMALFFTLLGNLPAEDQPAVVPQKTTRGDELLTRYFQAETGKLASQSLADIKTLEQWKAHRQVAHQQLLEMLGLQPKPERTPLQATITGTLDHPEFTVEKLHYQSSPGLYVTGNLYIPKNLKEKAPAILYVCGHGRVVKDGKSLGNKTHYQHHGEWFARNGYVCLTIDTLQLGEIEGLHHGTHNLGMWWWNSRGYTPAGVEAWNCIRALDYLETRPEVDATKIGVTGRSGGGAYSWWIAALDERIKVAVPVAGITNLQNHVVDGCVEGHCDCMYFVNTYRWDYAQLAALVAPRPLLITNTDKDGIFPLDGVVDVYMDVRKIYDLHGATGKLGLQISEGPHKDIQELQIAAFRWFNRFLKGENPPKDIEMAAVKFFEPEQLKVFEQLPEDQQNTKIQESFTQTAPPAKVPENSEEWQAMREEWKAQLLSRSFNGWPEQAAEIELKPVFSATEQGIHLEAFDFLSQENVPLRLYLAHRAGLKTEELDFVVLNPLDDRGWTEFLAAARVAFAEQLQAEELPTENGESFQEWKQMFDNFKWGMAYVAPRGIGPTAWDRNAKERIHIRRRFMLLGQTLDGMRVWDIRRSIQALRKVDGLDDAALWVQGEREMSGLVLYASLFEPNITRLDLWSLPQSHQQGPTFLNVLRFLDIPQAVALASENAQVRIYQKTPGGWEYPEQVAGKLQWPEKQLQIRVVEQEEE